MRAFGLLPTSQRGASLVEYALIVALVAVASIAALQIYGQRLSNQFSILGTTMGVAGMNPNACYGRQPGECP